MMESLLERARSVYGNLEAACLLLERGDVSAELPDCCVRLAQKCAALAARCMAEARGIPAGDTGVRGMMDDFDALLPYYPPDGGERFRMEEAAFRFRAWEEHKKNADGYPVDTSDLLDVAAFLEWFLEEAERAGGDCVPDREDFPEDFDSAEVFYF